MVEENELTQRQRYWLAHLKACEAQGVSLREYAQAQGLKLKSLYDWKWRLGQLGFVESAAKGGGFVAVQVESSTRARGGCRIHLANGVCVEFEVVLSDAAIGG